MLHGIALRVALEPFGMGLNGVLPIQVGTHAGDHAHAAFAGGSAALAEEIAVAQILSLTVERHLGLIEREDAGDAHQDHVHLQAGPVVRPLFDIERRRIVFRHVQLAQAANLAGPERFRGCVGGGKFRRNQRHGGQTGFENAASIDHASPSLLVGI
jgi:hypothetical protein